MNKKFSLAQKYSATISALTWDFSIDLPKKNFVTFCHNLLAHHLKL
ncbi:hypothetical protein MYAER_1875 [Microcystis aeruginosa NIES-2549]|uniref:Uncharacterized protein n=1 Tax=Microcystis aeruginosa NIES-2549 TaxID=1641812 RepID=A0A0F6RLB5_MICAE|nr:hypothetical protein MYAER_1875 [Microcystis aeruginosa NIES-2549]AOC52617.1 hypothetical protein amyaer_1896 [Microcystis aeruginosa NIES-2481]